MSAILTLTTGIYREVRRHRVSRRQKRRCQMELPFMRGKAGPNVAIVHDAPDIDGLSRAPRDKSWRRRVRPWRRIHNDVVEWRLHGEVPVETDVCVSPYGRGFGAPPR